MRSIIKFLWEKRLIPANGLKTLKGEDMHIIDYGKGTDEESGIVHDAKIEVGGIVWGGNVHFGYDTKNSDSHNNVILCIETGDNTQASRQAEHSPNSLRLDYPKEFIKELHDVIELHKRRFACGGTIGSMSSINLHNTLSRLLAERLEEKAANIEKTFVACNQNWEETLFRNFIRSFGFGIQSKEFEEFAGIINMQALGKHRDNMLQVEAIFFGQAGLLEEESIPYYYRKEATGNRYYNELVREYRFLSAKFNLATMDHTVWGNGHATPHLRIARLATIYHSRKFSLAGIAACNNIGELHDIICTTTQGYWHNHSRFGGTENYGNGAMKRHQADVLIINTVVPILYVYGKYRGDSTLCSKAEDFLYTLKGEENSIIKRWKEEGVMPQCAADTQALIQLTRRYCQTNNCKECPIAYYHIKDIMHNAV